MCAWKICKQVNQANRMQAKWKTRVDFKLARTMAKQNKKEILKPNNRTMPGRQIHLFKIAIKQYCLRICMVIWIKILSLIEIIQSIIVRLKTLTKTDMVNYQQPRWAGPRVRLLYQIMKVLWVCLEEQIMKMQDLLRANRMKQIKCLMKERVPLKIRTKKIWRNVANPSKYKG